MRLLSAGRLNKPLIKLTFVPDCSATVYELYDIKFDELQPKRAESIKKKKTTVIFVADGGCNIL